MSSGSEEQRSINLAILDEEESKVPFRNGNGDVEIGNIEDPVQFLLHSTHNYSNINSPSIHIVPSRIRDLNPRVFDPCQVSIGPLHRKDKNLQAFEGQKAIFLKDLLLYSGSQPEQTLETCVEKVKASIGRIKACYGDGIKGYSDDEITKMMVMDACFILEFLYKKSLNLFVEDMVIEPISMVYDLMLIENQIPFFVLEDVFECTSSRFEPLPTLHVFIICMFAQALGFEKSEFTIKKNKACNATDHYDHILGFLHEYYRPLSVDQPSYSEIYYPAVERNQSSDPYKDVGVNQSEGSEAYHSAYENSDSDSDEDFQIIGPPVLQTFYSVVELDRAGVNFSPHHDQPQDRRWSMDIQFEFPLCSWYRPWAKPTLRMPVLGIHNYTELVYRNLIAYEQLSPYRVPHYVTSYAVAMDLLIDNHEDVAILVKSKVIVNTIGSNEDIAKMINDMRKEISCPHFFYIDAWKKMNKYHDKVWPKNIARLRRTYFSNPWSIVALFAGIFLFLLTIVQTYFTINPW